MDSFCLLAFVFVPLAFNEVSGQDSRACDSGPSCLNAPSVASDSTGQVQCCQSGYYIQVQSHTINGKTVSKCTCTRSSNPKTSRGSQFSGGSVFVSSVNGDGPNFHSFQTTRTGSSQFEEMTDNLRQAISRISGLTKPFRLWN